LDPIYVETQLGKVCNSLKLRMGIRIADATGMTATSQAAITTAISVEYSLHADNATLQYTSAPPNTNPVWVDLVQSGRSDLLLLTHRFHEYP
jgi:hypothetical protein